MENKSVQEKGVLSRFFIHPDRIVQYLTNQFSVKKYLEMDRHFYLSCSKALILLSKFKIK